MDVCAIPLFLLVVRIVPFRKQILFQIWRHLQIVFCPEEKKAHRESLEANRLGCQNGVFIAVKRLIYL